jgi:two-component system phosphate regulon response regulator PhoB
MYLDCFQEDYEVIHAYDGADALMMAVEHNPDIILLDIMMPMLDGRTICKKIKSNPLTRDVKIVMVTGKSDQSDRLVGFELGADDYVEKPVSIAYLSRVVEKLVK